MNLDIHFLKEIVVKEKELGIYKYSILGIPFWRIVRFVVRARFLCIKTGFQYKTLQNNINLFHIIKNFFISLKDYINLFIKNINVDNVILAFPRLQTVGGISLDKFTDPIINSTSIIGSTIIFQRPLAGNHKKNRLNSKITIKTDFIEVSSKVLGILLLPIISIVYFRTVVGVFRNTKKYFLLNYKNLLFFFTTLSGFLVSYKFHHTLFKRLRPQKVFLVNREIFFPAILACKKLNIPVYELQHGVTHGETAVYSGSYDNTIDPDYFLIFGEIWKGPQFGMPSDRIINIGWAYKDFIKDHFINIPIHENSILVISEPHITTKILSITNELAQLNRGWNFHIRLHPQESLNDIHKKMLVGIDNVIIQDNSIESTLAIMSYKYLIGENSSVLYEALSNGKKVGRINYGGLLPEKVEGHLIDGFYYLNSPGDFEFFINRSLSESTVSDLVYSNFDQDIFNTKVNNKI